MSHALRDFMDEEKHLEEALKQIGKQIAAKLHRSPLAATTVAAQLRKRRDPDFWLDMLDQNLLNETMGALLLSYQNLPPPLQRCFAFCSLFPKGHKFTQDYLVRLWIAQGFIVTEDCNRHMRDIGNGYILELISNSFFQVKEEEWRTSYTIHDLLHDLAEKVSEGEYFRIEGGGERDIPIQTRHLYIDGDMFEEHVRKICKLKLLTIIIGKPRASTLKKDDLNALFEMSKMFYVVDIEECSYIKGLPESLFYLENLRYLNCDYTGVTKIPKLLTRLYQLRDFSLVCRFIPPGIHLANIGRLALLQHMPPFNVANERGRGLEQLEHLRDLRELVIYGLKYVRSSEEARRVKLSDKKGLRELILDWEYNEMYNLNILDDLHNPTRIKDAEVILDELCLPPQLERLTIRYYRGKRCPGWFSEYNKITTHLKELELCDCPFLEALPEINNLIDLQSVTIACLPELKWWRPLPSNLVNLELNDCSSLAFLSEEDIKIRMSTRSEKHFPTDKELEKLVDSNIYHRYLDKQKKLDHICQLKEVNGELHLPLNLQKLKMHSCFITDRILASSLQDHTMLTHLELCDILPITCIPREVLSSLINLRILRIDECLMLTSVGGLEALNFLKELKIKNCPYLAIETQVLVGGSDLKSLFFWNCLATQSLDFSNSKSLFELRLENCENLVSLQGLNELNNLKYVTIVGCNKLQCSYDANKLPGVFWKVRISKLSLLKLISRDGLSSLGSLIVEKAEQEYFTQEECEMLCHLPILETIEFVHCKMKTLPDLSCLHSLKELEISSCKDLSFLSELPPSVQRIQISRCNDEFTGSCKDTNHPNRQKISRIPQKWIY